MTAPLSEQQLAEIRARVEAATKGPWGTYDDGGGSIDIVADLELTDYGYTCRRSIARTDDDPIDNDPTHVDWDSDADLEQIEADAAFIAHAREDIPALLAEVERLTEAAVPGPSCCDACARSPRQQAAHARLELAAAREALAELEARDRRIADLEAERLKLIRWHEEDARQMKVWGRRVARSQRDVAAARVAGLLEAAEIVDNDDDCTCGGCDTCIPRTLAAEIRDRAYALTTEAGESR